MCVSVCPCVCVLLDVWEAGVWGGGRWEREGEGRRDKAEEVEEKE